MDETTTKPTVLFVHYTFTKQALQVTEDMESVFRDHGWEIVRAQILFTDKRYMDGNVVEILDTLAPLPPGINFKRDFRYYHGGVANAPAYQVEISAFGYFPGDTGISHFYPWLGFRVGIVGDLG